MGRGEENLVQEGPARRGRGHPWTQLLKPARHAANPGFAASRASSRHWNATTSACSMQCASPLHAALAAWSVALHPATAASRPACTGASQAWRVDRQFSTQVWSLFRQPSLLLWKSSRQALRQSLSAVLASLRHCFTSSTCPVPGGQAWTQALKPLRQAASSGFLVLRTPRRQMNALVSALSMHCSSASL